MHQLFSRCFSNARWVVALSLGVLLYLGFNSHRHWNVHQMWFSDAEGYYMYLPGTFIYGFEELPVKSVNKTQFPVWKGTNKRFTKYSCGVALLQSPFWFTAHILAKPFGYQADGYSRIYQQFILVATILFCLMGLHFTRKILLQHFSTGITAAVILMLLLGTNLLFYTTVHSNYSHTYSFAFIAAFMWYSIRFINKPSARLVILLSITLGVVLLLRPTNGLVVFWLFFYRVTSVKDLWQRVKLVFGWWRWLPVSIVIMFAFYFPQLLYWKHITGSWFVYSYKGESFPFWASPYVFDSWFHVRNGLFVYAPILLLTIPGFLLMCKNRQLGGWGSLVTWLLVSYLIGSWWAWWFGAAYGHRAYIDFLPVLAIPLGATIHRIWQQKIRFKYALLPFTALCIFLTIGLSYKYECCWDGPEWNRAKYFTIVKETFQGDFNRRNPLDYDENGNLTE